MSDKIKVCTGYRMTPAVIGMPKRVAYVAKRLGNLVTLLMIDGVVTAAVVPTEKYGREFAQVKTPFGMYNLSPEGEITDIAGAAEIYDIIRRRSYEN